MSEPSEPVTDPELDYDGYADARKMAAQTEIDQTKFIDQTILTLAGGALGLSLTFLRSFSAPIKLEWALYLGGALLTLSILGVLLSLQLSQLSLRRYIIQLDAAARRGFPKAAPGTSGRYVNYFARATQILNWTNSCFLIFGIVSLAAFG